MCLSTLLRVAKQQCNACETARRVIPLLLTARLACCKSLASSFVECAMSGFCVCAIHQSYLTTCRRSVFVQVEWISWSAQESASVHGFYERRALSNSLFFKSRLALLIFVEKMSLLAL